MLHWYVHWKSQTCPKCIRSPQEQLLLRILRVPCSLVSAWTACTWWEDHPPSSRSGESGRGRGRRDEDKRREGTESGRKDKEKNG